MRDKEEIEVLLTEYQACHSNRNHYASVRWTMGSIFIMATFTLFGFSFSEQVVGNFTRVFLLAMISMGLIVIWYAYYQHVNSWVLMSILRCHEIEQALRNKEYKIRLHKLIHETDKKHAHIQICGRDIQIRGIHITFLLLSIVVSSWYYRLSLFLPWFCNNIIMIIVWILIIIDVWLLILVIIYHIVKKMNPINLGEEIQKVLQKCACDTV